MKVIACILGGLVVVVAAQVGAVSAPAQKPLTGHVKKEQVRISRPGIPLNASTANTTLTPHVQSTDFDLHASTHASQPLGAQIQETGNNTVFQPMQPLVSKPMIEADLSSGTARGGGNTGGAGGGGGTPANYDYGAKPKVDYRTIVIRLNKFRAQNEMEVAWEATRMANRMLKKGAPVVVLLDWEAVHAADMNDTMNASNEKNRGNGNESAERLTTAQDHLRQFVTSGGKLVVSARWIKLFNVSQRAIIPGAQIASEDDIDDVLMDPNAQIIDY